MPRNTIHPLSLVHSSSQIGWGCSIWAWSQVREEAIVGDQSTIGQAAYIGPGVRIGPQCRIQNNALLFEPAVLEKGVFVGPGTVLTNDRHPRALNLDEEPITSADWDPVGVYIEEGASIGAQAVLIGPIRIGRWAMVGAGAVVSSDVKPFSLVLGVPARHVSWVGKSGKQLIEQDGVWTCPVTNERFREDRSNLVPLEDPKQKSHDEQS